MERELKAKWVTALRSGDYSQARKRFRDGDCFCCLAVLADVSGKGEWDDDEYRIGDEFDPERVTLDGELGLYGRPLFGIDEPTEKALINMNDEEGKNFCQIADYVEEAL